MKTDSDNKKSTAGGTRVRKKRVKCDWYSYCEECDDVVLGQCWKHPYVGSAPDPKPQSPRPESPPAESPQPDRATHITAPKIVSYGSVPAKESGEEVQEESEENPKSSESVMLRLVPASHFEPNQFRRMSEEEYARSVVYIPCKKEICVDQHGNELIVYDVKQADGTVVENFFMTTADTSTAVEPGDRRLVPEFRAPEAYPIKRIRRRSPPERVPPDGQQIFVCTFCGKRLTQSSSLTVHMRIHTGEKPYACEYCDKRFNHHSNLVKHERVHTGVQPYVCPYCGRSFNQSTHLKTHIFSTAHSRGKFSKKKKSAAEKKKRAVRRRRRKEDEEEELQSYEEVEKGAHRTKTGKKTVALVHEGDAEEIGDEIEVHEVESEVIIDCVEIKAEIKEEEIETEVIEENATERGASGED